MKLIRRISILFLLLAAIIPLQGCHHEWADPVLSDDDSDKTVLVLDIGILGDKRTRAGETTAADGMESMHSLRVILMSDGFVEYNEVVDFTNPVQYYENVVIETFTGQKQLYLIANEESVEYIKADGSKESLSALLARYPRGSVGFAAVFDDIYFELNPSKPLPLSSKYEFYAKKDSEELEFWLVRAATKYTVKFINNRSADIALNEFSLSYVADINYLLPHVGSTQQTIDGKFWIDWLRDVSYNSNIDDDFTHPDNSKFEGWITDYSLPASANLQTVFKPVADREDITIPGLQVIAGSEPEPGELEIGPFYAPEGKNLIDPNVSNGLQHYTVGLKLSDKKDNQTLTLTRVLPSLSALFRNTHVIITIGFSEGYTHIYAEIKPWEMRDNIYGSLEEEDEDE